MLELSSFESRRRVKSAAYVSAFLTALSGLTIALFPSIQESGVDFQEYIQNLPPEFRRVFAGSVLEFTTIEGFLVVEVYQWMWVLLLAIYFAYAAASTISSEVEEDSIDLVLVNPVSRTRYVVGKYSALAFNIVLVTSILLIAIYGSVTFIGESIDLTKLILLHTVFVIYLLANASLGLVSSVLFDRQRRAQVVSIGAVFGLFLVETLTFDTDYEWLGVLAFSRYVDPGEILIEGDVDWMGVAVLAIAAVALLMVAAEIFERRDIT